VRYAEFRDRLEAALHAEGLFFTGADRRVETIDLADTVRGWKATVSRAARDDTKPFDVSAVIGFEWSTCLTAPCRRSSRRSQWISQSSTLKVICRSRRIRIFSGEPRALGQGWLLPRFAPAPWETIVRDMWGVMDNEDMQWMLERLQPTPVGHFKDPVRRANPAAEKLPRTYIRCRQFRNPRFDAHAEMARSTVGWRYQELAASHHAAVTMPDKVANLLLEA
jgi:hypothetical protein